MDEECGFDLKIRLHVMKNNSAIIFKILNYFFKTDSVVEKFFHWKKNYWPRHYVRVF